MSIAMDSQDLRGYLGNVPLAVEFGWRRTGNYAALLFASTTAGLSFAS